MKTELECFKWLEANKLLGDPTEDKMFFSPAHAKASVYTRLYKYEQQNSKSKK